MKTLEKIMAGALLIGTLGAGIGCQNTNMPPKYTFMGETYKFNSQIIGNKTYTSPINPKNKVAIYFNCDKNIEDGGPIDVSIYQPSTGHYCYGKTLPLPYLSSKKNIIEIMSGVGYVRYTGFRDYPFELAGGEDDCVTLIDTGNDLAVDKMNLSSHTISETYLSFHRDVAEDKEVMNSAQHLFDKTLKEMRAELKALEQAKYSREKEVQQILENLSK